VFQTFDSSKRPGNFNCEKKERERETFFLIIFLFIWSCHFCFVPFVLKKKINAKQNSNKNIQAGKCVTGFILQQLWQFVPSKISISIGGKIFLSLSLSHFYFQAHQGFKKKIIWKKGQFLALNSPFHFIFQIKWRRGVGKEQDDQATLEGNVTSPSFRLFFRTQLITEKQIVVSRARNDLWAKMFDRFALGSIRHLET